jgi:hypothetical protein
MPVEITVGERTEEIHANEPVIQSFFYLGEQQTQDFIDIRVG